MTYTVRCPVPKENEMEDIFATFEDDYEFEWLPAFDLDFENLLAHNTLCEQSLFCFIFFILFFTKHMYRQIRPCRVPIII